MALTKEVLDTIAADVEKAENSLKALKDVVSDMKLSGMETAKQEAEVASLSTKIRSLKAFYELRKAKL